MSAVDCTNEWIQKMYERNKGTTLQPKYQNVIRWLENSKGTFKRRLYKSSNGMFFFWQQGIAPSCTHGSPEIPKYVMRVLEESAIYIQQGNLCYNAHFMVIQYKDNKELDVMKSTNYSDYKHYELSKGYPKIEKIRDADLELIDAVICNNRQLVKQLISRG